MEKLMENIPAPAYPGPPLECDVTPQPAPRRQCSSQEEFHRQIPDPQNNRSLPLDNIPVPPYPGPPLESTNFVQQRSVFPEPPPQRQCSVQERRPCNHQQTPNRQNYRSLSTENMPCPPYPGPPLDPTCFVQQRSFTSHPASQRQFSSQEGGPYNHQQTPDPRNYRALQTESMPVPPYPGFPYPERSPSPQPPLRRQYQVTEEITPHIQCAANSRTVVPTESKAFSINKLLTSLEQTINQAQYNAKKSTIEIAKQTTEYLKVRTQKAEISLSQHSSNTQLTQAQSSASMYAQNVWGTVQPGVRVVQSGATQVILPAQSPQMVYQPGVSRTIIQSVNPQPTVVIHNTTPTVRVIQPQVLPTVIQPAPRTVVYHRYY